MKSVLFGLCMLAGSGIAAAADEGPMPTVGSVVQLSADAPTESTVVGTVTAIDANGVSLAIGPNRPVAVFERDHIRRLRLQVRPSRKRHGALVGFGIGAGAGIMAGLVVNSCEDGGSGCVYPPLVAAGGVAVGLIGSAIGAASSPGPQWADVPADWIRESARSDASKRRARMTVVPILGRGTGVLAVLSF